MPITREQYADYLRSEEWAARRTKVMQRAGGICEGCRDRPAEEVHHLTYEHVTQEFLFELVAMCGDCHARFHGELARPRVSWTPRHTGASTPKESPGAQARRGLLHQAAVKARAEFMARDLPEPPPPIAERVAALAEQSRADAIAPRVDVVIDVPEAEHGEAA